MRQEMEYVMNSIQTGETRQIQRQSDISGNDIRYDHLTIYSLKGDGEGSAVIRIDDVTEKVQMPLVSG